MRDGVVTTTTFSYDAEPKTNNPRAQEFIDSQGITHRTEYTYPGDLGSGAPVSMYDTGNPNYKHVPGAVIEQKNYVDGILRSKESNEYIESGSKLLLNATKSFPTGTADFVKVEYSYDNSSRVISAKKSDGSVSSYQWGYNNQYPVLEVKNALPNEIFYTGFEDGNFLFEPKTGRRCSGQPLTVNVPAGGPYTLSYWHKSSSGTWQLVQVDNITTNQTIGGSGSYIDDVRLHPKGALMTTYTYDLGLGITSMSDPNNKITFYKYDEFGRLKLLKDDKENVVKEYKYHYKGQN
jgi:hypothetical protein